MVSLICCISVSNKGSKIGTTFGSKIGTTFGSKIGTTFGSKIGTKCSKIGTTFGSKIGTKCSKIGTLPYHFLAKNFKLFSYKFTQQCKIIYPYCLPNAALPVPFSSFRHLLFICPYSSLDPLIPKTNSKTFIGFPVS